MVARPLTDMSLTRLLSALLALASGAPVYGAPVGPPTNPFLAQTFNNQGHWNDAATDSTDIAVPRGFYQITPQGFEIVPSETVGIPHYSDIVRGKEVFWYWTGFALRKLHRVEGKFVEIDRVSIDNPLPDYRAISAHERIGQASDLKRLLHTGDEAQVLDYLRRQPNRLQSAIEDQVRHGILYSLLTRENAVIGANARGLIRIDQVDPEDPYSRLKPAQQVQLASELFDDARAKANTSFPTDTVFGLGMTFNGFLVVNTIGGKIITLDRAALSVVDVYQVAGPDEVFTNSFATSEECQGGAVYVASNTTLYRLVVDQRGQILTEPASGAWQARYDRGIRIKTGKIADGTGSTPTLMGFGDDQDKLVVITDGAQKMRLTAFWRDRIPKGWRPRRGALSSRQVDAIEVDLGSAVSVVQSEQSVVVYDQYAFVVNNIAEGGSRPYLAPGAFYRGLLLGATRPGAVGAAMYRWRGSLRQWQRLWVRTDVGAVANTPMISGGSRMAIINGYPAGAPQGLYHYGFDLDTGATVLSIDTGLDPLFNGAFSGIKCDSDGNLWYPMMFGLVRLDVSQMKSLN